MLTATRAEYGLLYWLLRELQADKDICLQLIVTGMHLSQYFGMTIEDIEADGFTIDERIDIELEDDSPVGIARSMSLCITRCVDALERLCPDIFILLGDRFEILAAAQAAMLLRIPIAHIHGGEATEGLIDEAIRHAVTKMAHLHFTASESFRRRVIQLGEQPDKVFTVGATGLDNIERLQLLERPALENHLGRKLGETNFLVTYHPVTLEKANPTQSVQALLHALSDFPDAFVIFTYANADMSGRAINSMLEDYVKLQPHRTMFCGSLGQRVYLSVMRLADIVIGNSSSGIIEAPALGTPTVNIGCRQSGRPRAPSVVDCRDDAVAIKAGIRQALMPEFRALAAKAQTPFGTGGAARKIMNVLKAVQLDGILLKKFYDLSAIASERIQ